MSTFGIVVGGGPAPGINGVIGAAATVAQRRGHRVIGEISSAYNRSRFGRSDVEAVERARLERQWRPLRNAMIGRMVSRVLKRARKNSDRRSSSSSLVRNCFMDS